MKFVYAAIALLLCACTDQIYQEASDKGRFEGSILVLWVGPGDQGKGDGRFVYVPDFSDKNGLVFYRDPALGAEVSEIRPQVMYTDGGSIPRIFQPVRGFNPWGYAPAYMVHDWLFAARKCINANIATPQELATESIDFRESYVIMAEMLKTLERKRRVSESDFQPAAITFAVSTGISRDLWVENKCAEPRIAPKDREDIEARLGYDIYTGKRLPTLRSIAAPSRVQIVGSVRFP